MSILALERSEKPEDWVPVIERVTFQVAYRQLGTCALYVPIDVAIKAIDILCKRGMGSWRYLLEDRAIVWEDVPTNHALKTHLYVFGGKSRRKNTVFVRQGFWRMYFIESTIRTFDKTVIGRLLAKI